MHSMHEWFINLWELSGNGWAWAREFQSETGR